jgi:uncharacterized protein YndB with AHSA1/START domain
MNAIGAPVRYEPLIRTVTVAAAPEAAFRRFTAEMNAWWPLASHSVGQSRAERVEMRPGVGGLIVETIAGGEESIWGTITQWDPPTRVAFTWHPGDEPARAQDVEVRFEPAGAGTLVTLTHTGFERLGEQAKVARRVYPLGWTYVLGRYAEQRGVAMTLIDVLTRVMMFVGSRVKR